MTPKELVRRYAAGERNFAGVVLPFASFRDARLEGICLRGANLLGADLVNCHLDGADLEGANLRGAKLGDTRLVGANLRLADLRDAHLRARFSGADLEDAWLTSIEPVTEGGGDPTRARIMTLDEFRRERLARDVDPSRLSEHLDVALEPLCIPSDSDDEWEAALVFPRFQAWLTGFEEMSWQLAARAAFGAALSTLGFWQKLETSPEARDPLYVCPPGHKLEGIAKYLASPNPETLRRLAPLVDVSSQAPRRFHPEFWPWFDEGDAYSLEARAGWCEEAADFGLETLLCAVMGPYDDAHNAVANSLWFCGMTAFNAHRSSRTEGNEAVQRIVTGIRMQMTTDKLAVTLRPSERCYGAPVDW